MELIVDLQGYKKGNNFVLKELAVCSLDNQLLQSYMFETPVYYREYSYSNFWLQKHHHSIPYRAGEISYDKIEEILQSLVLKAKVIYLKGIEKRDWLLFWIPYFKNIEDLHGLPSLKSKSYSAQPSCALIHENCALTHVLQLRDYVNRNFAGKL